MKIGLAYINPAHVVWIGPVLQYQATDIEKPFYFRVEVSTGNTYNFDFDSKEFADKNRNYLIKFTERTHT